MHTAATGTSVNESLMRWTHGSGGFGRAMHLPVKQAGTRLARARKDSITGVTRRRLTTFGHVASAMGKIMVKEVLTRTNSDLASSRHPAGAAARSEGSGSGWIEQPGGTQLSGLSGKRYGP